MMNARKFLVTLFSLIVGVASYAQSNLLNAKTPAEIGLKTAAQLISDNDKPLAYGYVHDRDILMGKTVWEIIDLSEKIKLIQTSQRSSVKITIKTYCAAIKRRTNSDKWHSVYGILPHRNND